jgi:hypothetical protein
MSDLSTLANVAEILGVIIVVGGLYFAILQLRQFRQRRRELAAIEVFRFFGNHKFTEAYLLVLHLPDGISAEDIRAKQVNLADAAMLICSTMEVIGVMTFQRNVSFSTVDNLIGQTTIILWRKLQKWVVALRTDSGNESAFEWFQWLAERLEQYQPSDPHPAYDGHKDWVPLHRRYKR